MFELSMNTVRAGIVKVGTVPYGAAALLEGRLKCHARGALNATVQTRIAVRARVIAGPFRTSGSETAFAWPVGRSANPAGATRGRRRSNACSAASCVSTRRQLNVAFRYTAMSELPLAALPLAAHTQSRQEDSEDHIERSFGPLTDCQCPRVSPAAVSCGEPLRANDSILAMVAHELRGFLAPLRLVSELLRRTCDGQPETLRSLDMFERQITQIAQLAEDLMDVARVDHNVLRLSKTRARVGDVVADVIDAARLAAVKRGQSLRVTCPEPDIQIEADPGRLAQALYNLLHNAEKYTPPGGRIDLDIHADGPDLVISVKDNGLGISNAVLPHVFELFSQSSRTIAASAGGMGIGLSVVKAVAEAHGGSATAISDGPSCGSAFVLRMPIVVTQVMTPGAVPEFGWGCLMPESHSLPAQSAFK